MKIDQYSPDVICKLLGIGEFWTRMEYKLPRAQPLEELRILLCPSFDPELCLTFWSTEEDAFVRVVCASTQIWLLSEPGPIETVTDTGKCGDSATLPGLETRFRQAISHGFRRGIATTDGMGAYVTWRYFSEQIHVDRANAAGGLLAQFLAPAIVLAYDSIISLACKDALATAGGYVNLDLPKSNSF